MIKEDAMNETKERGKRSTRRGRREKIAVKTFVIIIATPLILLALGFLFESIASRSDPVRYPPPGKMVDIGGYGLHLVCEGERRAGQPLVLIEAGSGSSSPDWALVLPEIGGFARVCTYDRAGLGWSDPGPPPRTSMAYASEMEMLLERSEEEPPYLLVAHSLGGHTARIFTADHPEEVAGMILIDARPPSRNIPSKPMGSGQLRLWEFLARCGFFRIIGKQMFTISAPSMLETFPDYPFPIAYDADYFRTNRIQDEGLEESDSAVRETGPFEDIPLVIITHGIPSMFDWLSEEEKEVVENTWQAEQKKMLGLSTNSQLIIAEGSGHNINAEAPEIVIDAVREMVEGK
jgi:pimeloyl-ACP methyl ester carboxylesterase